MPNSVSCPTVISDALICQGRVQSAKRDWAPRLQLEGILFIPASMKDSVA